MPAPKRRCWPVFLAEFALIVAIGAIVSIAPGTASAQPPARNWTVMIYMNGKNSLEADALNNFYAMSSVGSSKEVAFVAEMGRPQRHFTGSDGGWSGVYRFYVQKDSKPVPQEAVDDPSSRNESLDMGRPAALESFVKWGLSAYPAKHYMLVIWNHGQGYRLQLNASPLPSSGSAPALTSQKPSGVVGGVRAVSSDDDYGSILYNAEVADVVAKTFTSQKLDLMGFDACLMAMMETAYAFEPHAQLMIGSEEVEPGDGWQYADWMAALVAQPALSPEDLGRGVVEAYRHHYGDQYATTLSLIQLQGTQAVAAQLSALADAVRRAGNSEVKTFYNARLEVASYAAGEYPPWRTSTDLITILKHYEGKTTSPALRSQSAQVRAAIGRLVLDNYASVRSVNPDAGLPFGSEGLAIYFPEDKSAFDQDAFHTGYLKSNTDRPVAFVQRETWANLVYEALGITGQ